MIRLEMRNYNTISTEKQQKYQHNSGKIEKYEYLTGAQSSDQGRAIEKAKFIYLSLGKALKQ